MLKKILILSKIFIQPIIAIFLMGICIFIPFFLFKLNSIIVDSLYDLLNIKNSYFLNTNFYLFFDYLNTGIKFVLGSLLCISLFAIVISFLNFKDDKNFTLIKILSFGGSVVFILSILLFLMNTMTVMLLSFFMLFIIIIFIILKILK